jgi:hypothetical protein
MFLQSVHFVVLTVMPVDIAVFCDMLLGRWALTFRGAYTFYLQGLKVNGA